MGNKIRELPKTARPYEKVMKYGPGGLDDSELLAVVLRTGTKGRNSVDTAREVLKKGGGTLSGFRALSFKELMSVPGIGEVKAVQLLCLSELAVRFSKSESPERLVFSDPGKVAAFFMEEMRILKQEELRVIFLNTKSRFLGTETVTRGSVNASMMPVREILISALKHEAVYMILLHNHPSGDPEPSSEDLSSTKQIVSAGSLSGISVLDHIIIGDHRYVSLRERGLMP